MTNLSHETLPSQEKIYVFDFFDFGKNSLESQGVEVINSIDVDKNLETFFI